MATETALLLDLQVPTTFAEREAVLLCPGWPLRSPRGFLAPALDFPPSRLGFLLLFLREDVALPLAALPAVPFAVVSEP